MKIPLSVACVAAGLLAAAGRAAGPIEVLLVDGRNNHDWAATTPVLKAILERSGRFRVRVATARDPATFRPDFAAYRAVVSNYNGPAWPEATRRAFIDFVAKGGGVVIVHAADNAFPGWGEYNEVIGVGGWGGRTEASGPWLRWDGGRIVRDGRPGPAGHHGKRHEFLVELRAPAHPILLGLPPAFRHGRDELYDRLRGPARNLRVLATAFSDPATGGSGEHEPMLMAIRYGKGRVFHTTLGHDVEAMRGLGFQVTLQRGTEWAATGRVTFAPVPGRVLPAKTAAYRDPRSIEPDGGGWVPLFDGRSLQGWTRRAGTAGYAVAGGTITGATAEGSPNSFLCTDREFGDFDLRFEVLLDDGLNSGVQIRSRTRGNVVRGPQVEIAGNGNAGFLYGEALDTGWLSRKRDDPAKNRAFVKGRWNDYRVLAAGDRIRTWVNGIPVADLRDDRSGMRRGFIGLQVHRVPSGRSYRVAWRGLFVRELQPPASRPSK